MFVHFADAPTYCIAWLRMVPTVLNFTKWTHTKVSKIALCQLRNSLLSYEIPWLLHNSYEVSKIQPQVGTRKEYALRADIYFCRDNWFRYFCWKSLNMHREWRNIEEYNKYPPQFSMSVQPLSPWFVNPHYCLLWWAQHKGCRLVFNCNSRIYIYVSLNYVI